MFRKIYEMLTLADYEAASQRATKQVVKRYTRGNISLKNGLCLTEKDARKLTEQGDQAVLRLNKKIGSR